MRVLPGRFHPLGAGWDGEGVNFTLFSENATAVDLCLFDQSEQTKESYRIRIKERTRPGLARLPTRSSSWTHVRVSGPQLL